MTQRDSFPPDPLIDEVRRRRRELFNECDNDLKKFGQRIRERQAEHPDKIVDLRKTKFAR